MTSRLLFSNLIQKLSSLAKRAACLTVTLPFSFFNFENYHIKLKDTYFAFQFS